MKILQQNNEESGNYWYPV